MSPPPRWAEALLSRALQHPGREEVLGDLHEELQRRGGGPLARLRYGWQALAIALRVLAARTFDGTATDAGLALRRLRTDPGFAVVAVGALALGIGVSATILAVADDVLLDPLPYPQQDRLGVLTNDHTGSTWGGFGVSYLNMQIVAEGAAAFDSFALFLDWQDLTLSGRDTAVRVPSAFVDNAYFDLMGLEMLHGRWILPNENRAEHGAPVVVLSRGAWERLYGGDPGVVGRIVRLNGLPHEIIGVLDDGRGDLRYRWSEQPVDFFLPLFAAEQLTDFDLDGDRGARVLNALMLMREDVSLAAARAELAGLSAELAREFPRQNEGWSYNLEPLDEAFFADLQGPLRILVSGSILVFALVTLNLLSLVLIRVAGRRAELTVRRALGARGGRLMRQLITESLVLCIVGGAIGLLLAAWGTGAVASSGLLDLPSFASIRLEGWIVSTVVVAALGAGCALGLGASLASRGAIASRESSRATAGPSRQRLRSILVGAEVALAFTLLVGAGLVLNSFLELRSTGYGFDTDNLVLTRVDARGGSLPRAQLPQVADRLAAEGAALPGVLDAFIWSPNRLGHGNQVEILTAQGRYADHPEERLEASLHTAHPGTLAKLGIPLLAGRDVAASDTADGARVALVSARLAADLWPGENAVGKRFETVEDDELIHVEVIGVVADARHRTRLIDPFGPQRDVYYPFVQSPWPVMTLALRTESGVDSAPLAAAVRQIVAAIDGDVPVYEIVTMSENLREEEASARLSAALVLLYALLAVALAALGLYGMLAHVVRARRQEIGVRMALGADARDVLARTLRSGAAPVVVGGLIGLGASLAVGSVLAGTLYGVSAYDPATYCAVPLLLSVVATVALYFPARRASRTDPVDVLRPE